MGLDLSKIKGISDDVKAKLAKVKNKDEFDARPRICPQNS